MSAYILSATRTAVGTFGGALKPLNAVQMGALAITEALQRAGVAPEAVGGLVMGNVLQAGSGTESREAGGPQGRVARLGGRLTVNKVCGSGLKAIALAAQSIVTGDAELVLAGGIENMSIAPYLLRQARTGYRMGHDEIIDSMIAGRPSCAGDTHMGITAENVAAKYGISREAQDEFSWPASRRRPRPRRAAPSTTRSSP